MHAAQEHGQIDFLSLVERISKLVSSTLESQIFFNQLLDELIAGLKIDACWVHLFNPELEKLELVAHRGFTEQMVKEMSWLRLGQSFPGKVALSEEPLVNHNVHFGEGSPYNGSTKASLRCFVASPMISRNRVFGVIGLGSRNPNSFTNHELKLLSIVGLGAAMVADRTYLLHSRDETEKVERLSALSQEQEFINALSHELQTPLTALIASAGLLIDELRKESKGPQLRLAQNIAQSASSLQNRVEELIELSRTKATRFRIDRKPFNFSTLIQKVIEELSPLMNGKGQTLTVKMEKSIPVTADEQRMEQILLNLLSNAVKFTPQGGQIALRSQVSKDMLTVEIQDTGHGIPEDEQKKLFRPYYRLLADRHRIPGLGLGLAITRQLVELHNGRIWMESKPGEGSTFFFSIPLS